MNQGGFKRNGPKRQEITAVARGRLNMKDSVICRLCQTTLKYTFVETEIRNY